MKTRASLPRRAMRGFTLVEAMISMTLVVLTVGLTLGTFIFSLKSMYKDGQRLATNATLRYFTAHVAKETLDSSEFHIFPTYQKLDGSVNLTTDVSPQVEADYGTEASYGDCLVLVTRVNLDEEARIRQFRIYYRVVTNANAQGVIRYYESTDYGTASTQNDLAALLNAVNLNSTPAISGSRQLVSAARGRPITKTGTHLCPLSSGTPFTGTCTHTTDYYPIFSSETSTATPVNDGVSINVEIINGASAMNQLSSSSFNYTISPRR